jgi:hypothetical protein
LIRPTDEVNQELLELRNKQSLLRVGPAVGDWVLFNKGVARRISYIWNYDGLGNIKPIVDWGIQTSEPGYHGWYLGNGYIQFSGGLFLSVKGKHLRLTEEVRPAWVWFFSRDDHKANGAVYYKADFRVWDAEIDAPDV